MSLQERTPLLQGHFFILKGTLFNRRATVIFQRFNPFTSIKIKFIWRGLKTGSWHFITKVPYIRFWHIKLYNKSRRFINMILIIPRIPGNLRYVFTVMLVKYIVKIIIIIITLKCNLFSSLHSWKIAHFVLNNNHSLN